MTIPAGAAQRRLAEALLLLALLAIAGLTLGPAPIPDGVPVYRFVLLGSLADVLRNVALYLPLGAALALRGVGPRAGLAIAGALAAAIELAQFAIPGRASSPDDVLANTLGAGLGLALVRTAPRWLTPDAAAARRLERLALSLWLANLVASAWLTAPALTPGPWFAHWNPALGSLVPYPGRLAEATLAGEPLPHGTLGDAPAARAALAAGEPLRVRLVSSGPSAGFEGIFLISDAADRELALLAIEGEDLVFRVRSRARALGLEPALLRARGAWRGAGAGAPVALEVSRAGAAWCLARDASRDCGLGFSAASGWSVLLPVLEFPAGAGAWLDALWLAGLAFPLGLWWRRDAGSWCALAIAGVALGALPAAGWLLPTAATAWLAAAGGWLAGRALGGAVSSGGGRSPRAPADRGRAATPS